MTFQPIDFQLDLRLALLAEGTTVVQLDQAAAEMLCVDSSHHPLFAVATVGHMPVVPFGGRGMQASVLSLAQLAWLQAEISSMVGRLPEDQQARYYATVPGALEYVNAHGGTDGSL